MDGAPPTASVVCILDFFTGRQLYQTSLDAHSLTIGSLAHDPTHLLAGAHDGTVSVWRPPECVRSEILGALEDMRREALSREERALSRAELEEAVASYWSGRLQHRIDWEHWGDAPRSEALPREPAEAPSWEEEPLFRELRQDAGPLDDVVVQARQGVPPRDSGARAAPEPCGARPPAGRPWPGGARAPVWPPPERCLPPGGVSLLKAAPVEFAETRRAHGRAASPRGHAASPGLGSTLPLQDDGGGLTVRRLVAGAAAELREEFGTLQEHFADPVPWTPPDRLPQPRAAARAMAMQISQFELDNPEAMGGEDASV